MKRTVRVVIASAAIAWVEGACGAQTAAATSGSNSLEALRASARAQAAHEAPTSDDWACELLWERARVRCADLARALTEQRTAVSLDIAKFFAPVTVIDVLRPSGGTLQLSGRFRVRTAPLVSATAPTLPASVFARLLDPFRSCADLRFTFDAIAVRATTASAFETDLRVRVSGTTQSGPLAIDARWTVDWLDGGAETPPLIRAIHVSAFRECTAPVPLFRDATRAVVRDDALWSQRIGLGAERWFGAVDTTGESNLLGENGLAIADANGDGLDDLYVALGTGIPNLLFLQQPDGSARESAAESGLDWLDDTKGCLFLDLDGDGDQDLVASMASTLVVHHNDGAGHFKPVRKLGGSSSAVFTSVSAADFDRDGDLDLFATRARKGRFGEHRPVPFADAQNGAANHLLRNDGEAGFTDATSETGLDVGGLRFSVASAWSDYDDDGDQDLVVANDFGSTCLYRNTDGHFIDVSNTAGLGARASASGAAWGDYDGDGRIDLLVSGRYSPAGLRVAADARLASDSFAELRTNLRHLASGNRLFNNLGDGSFREVAFACGATGSGWSSGAQFVDLTNEGTLGIVVPNGFVSAHGPAATAGDLASFFWRRVAASEACSEGNRALAWVALHDLLLRGRALGGDERTVALANLGDGSFVDASVAAGFDIPADGRALAVTDWDGDGDLDLWFKGRTGPVLRFLCNDTASSLVGARDAQPANANSSKEFLELRLVGHGQNRDAIGARVELEIGGHTLVRELTAGSGGLSQSSKWIHFGLAGLVRALPKDAPRSVDKLRVQWPGRERKTQTFTNVAIGQHLEITVGAAEPVVVAPRAVVLASAPALASHSAHEVRIALRVPMQLPPSFVTSLFAKPSQIRARVVSLWSSSSQASLEAIASFAAQSKAIDDASVDCLMLDIGPATERAAARALFEERVSPPLASSVVLERAVNPRERAVLAAVLESVHGVVFDDLTAPTTLLIDRDGMLEIVYMGPVAVPTLLADVRSYALQLETPGPRSPFPGNWFFFVPRDHLDCARRLRERERREEAGFYDVLGGKVDVLLGR